VAGGTVTLLVQAKDQYGNPLTTGGATVAFSLDSGAGTVGAPVIDSGNGAYQVLVTAPTVLSSGTSGVFSATVGGASVKGGGALAQTVTVNYVPSTATTLAITGSGSQNAGTSQNLTITAKDVYGNSATSYTGDKSLTFTGASTAAAGQMPSVVDKTGTTVVFGTATTIEFTAGVATVSSSQNGVMTLYAAESASISVTDGSVSSASPLAVVVSPASAAQLAMATLPVAGLPGSALTTQPIVTIADTYGNRVTGDSTTQVTVSASAGTLVGTTTETAASGLVTYTDLTFDGSASTSYTLTFAEDPFVSLTDATATITPTAEPVVPTSTSTTRAALTFVDRARIPSTPPAALTSGTVCGAVTVDSDPVEGAVWSASGSDTGWDVTGSGYSVQVSDSDATHTPIDVRCDGRLELPVLSQIQVRGSGFMPGMGAHVFLIPTSEGASARSTDDWSVRARYFEPAGGAIYVGSAPINAQGGFDADLALSADITPGSYILEVSGMDPQGQVRSVLMSASFYAPVAPRVTQVGAFFESDSATFSTGGEQRLSDLVSSMSAEDAEGSLVLVAYASSRSSTKGNLRLARERVTAMERYFSEHGWNGETTTAVLAHDVKTGRALAQEVTGDLKSERLSMSEGQWADFVATSSSGRLLSTVTFESPGLP